VASPDPGGRPRLPGLPEARVAVRLLAIEARRPAAWMLLGAGGVSGWLAAELPADRQWFAVPVAVACGGLLAGAACGQSPGQSPGRRTGWSARGLGSLTWPLAGLLAPLSLSAGSGSGQFVVLTLAGSLLATAIAIGGCPGAGTAIPVGIGLALAGAAAAAALAVGLVVPAAPVVQAVGAAAIWILMAAAARVAGREPADEPVWQPARSAAGIGLASSGMPGLLVAAALGTSLAAMVVCYFLAPQTAWLYAIVSGWWFVTLAAPPATAPPGGLIGHRLAASAAGRPAVPGSFGRAARGAAIQLAFLGWPAVVALVVPAPQGPRAGGPLVALAGLGAAAGLLLTATAVGRRTGLGGRPLALGTLAVALAAAAAGLPKLPRSPDSGEFPARTLPAEPC